MALPPTDTLMPLEQVIAHPLSASTPSSALSPSTVQQKSENDGLLPYISRSVDEDEEFYFLRFESLQRTNITALQLKLIRLKDSMRNKDDMSNDDLEILRITLEQYSTAIQNYAFTRRRKDLPKSTASKKRLLLQRYFHSHVNDITSFNSHYSSLDESDSKLDPLRSALMSALPAWMTYSRNERSARKREFSEGKSPREVSAFVDRLCRFMTAAVGGLFLVGPVLIMANDASTKKSLITISASVLVFIAVLTFGVRVSTVEALISTATYAAVLVVFLGSSTVGNG